LNDTKCKLGMVLEAIFQQVDKPYELIKWDFSEFEKAKFQGVACSKELIFCFLNGLICDLGTVKRAMLQGDGGICQLIFYLPGSLKCDLGEFKCFNRSSSPVNAFSAFWPSQNATRVSSINRYFKMSVSIGTHILPSARPKMRLRRCRERCFKGSVGHANLFSALLAN
jgi:hypothetical protein